MAPNGKLTVPSFASFTSTWHNTPYGAISLSRPEMSMAGRTVVITGGGTGIGKAIAMAFARAGASSVAIVGRREDRLKSAVAEIASAVNEAKQGSLLYEVVDLTDRKGAAAAFQRIAQKQGAKIDILVSNAGDLIPPGAVLDADEESLMRTFDYNVRIPLNTVHAFMPHAAADAVLLNISSGIAHMKPVPGLGAHAMSKAAGVMLMEYIEVENPGLRVVNIQPASVATEMSEKARHPGPNDSADLPGHFCVWLASSEAAFLHGKFVWGNWDVGEMMARADEIQSSRLLSIMLQGVSM